MLQGVWISGQAKGGAFRNLDQESVLQAALQDPAAFVREGGTPRYIDEVQRGGDPLVREIKAVVDSDWSKGQYYLAGSSRFLTVPTLSESLAGRAGLVEVWPLSQGEMRGRPEQFTHALMGRTEMLRNLEPERLGRADYVETIWRGGFPEPLKMPTRARASWFDDYIATVTDRDLREMARVNEPSAARQVLRALAAATSQELVITALAQRTELRRETVARYVGLLEVVFLVHEVPIWSRNLSKRMVKHPKVHLVDSGLAAHILGASPSSMASTTSPELGPLTETFVFGEIAKQVAWADELISVHHYRESSGAEVDLVLETRDGRVGAVEVKASSTVRAEDFRHLAYLRDAIGERFANGVVFYLGDEVLPFGDRITALPMSGLWAHPVTAVL
ncbi:hypothetical protein EDD99_7487 [Streptomyces sp. 846.5]|nr:ATP-binding protein [Streptomyces sp. 846.5]TDT95652.1 hypothetical protein EDD99_7487 [Streptomyces sp. 846.5]